ncbi:MAG TPA: hypothetical protein EYH50_01735 [Pyrodictium delaneyi]|uniref:Uncharacterized protein n=1 Tax=Pyrodictium delaneyi TaxID=1273541 RepID=A0A832ZT69_9CREN|nr:hypothetical protein [Pyrodictium delaneyi]
MVREAVAHILSKMRGIDPKRLLPGVPSRAVLAAFYAAELCRLENCSEETAAIAALAYAYHQIDSVVDRIPQHIVHHVRKVLEEAEDAHLRSPSSQYAMVVLDADVLARIGALSLFNRFTEYRASITDMLQAALDILSYTVASDYILYTRSAKKLASRMKPHTIAYFNWLVEELANLGIKARLRTEATVGGIISYVDLLSCPCGKTIVKEKAVKPAEKCMRYILRYTCRSCGLDVKAATCIPASTRTR